MLNFHQAVGPAYSGIPQFYIGFASVIDEYKNGQKLFSHRGAKYCNQLTDGIKEASFHQIM